MNGLPCQDAEFKAEKYGGNPSKMLENPGVQKICEGEYYASKYGTSQEEKRLYV
jgi:hypothetical protein